MAKQDMTPEMLALLKAMDEGTLTPEDVIERIEMVTIKGDPLAGFTGSPTFHLDRSHISSQQKKLNDPNEA